jgi:hypothetical protein
MHLPQQVSAAAGSPRDQPSDSESVSSAKDSSDSGDIPPAGLVEEESSQLAEKDSGPPTKDALPSRTAAEGKEEEEPNKESSPVAPNDDLLLLAKSNGLHSSLYESSHNGCEEPIIVDGSIIEGMGLSPAETSGTNLRVEDRTPGLGGEAREEEQELGVAADLFWDSVTSRAQVLSVPSFKISRQKPFSHY